MDAAAGRKQILSAAIEVFAEKGRRGTKMKEVALRATVTGPFLRRHYPRKEDLFKEVLETVADEIFRRIGTAPFPSGRSNDPVSVVGCVADILLDLFSENPDLGKIALHTVVSEPEEVLSVIKGSKSTAYQSCAERLGMLVSGLDVPASGGEVEPAGPPRLLAAVVGMALTFLLARPIAGGLLDIEIDDTNAFQSESRKNTVELWTRILAGRDSSGPE